MKHFIISILVIFFLASLSFVPAYAQLPNLSLYQAAVKTQYELKLEVGKQYYIQMITEQQISSGPTRREEGSMVMTLGTGAKLDVNNIDANGNAQVTYTYKWARSDVKFPNMEIVYDSSQKGTPVPEGMEWLAALMEESFSLTISPEGRISEIKDLDKVRNNVQQKLPQGQMQGIAMSSLNQWLDEQNLRESIENTIAIFPDRPVGMGDSWSRNVTYSSGSAMILESKWTLKERKNGVAVIEVVSTIKPNPQAKPTEMGSPGVTSSSEFTGRQQGLIEMQESTGLIISSRINQQMSGQTTITRPGMSDTVTPMEITGVVRMETSDWEKARSIVGTNAVTEGQSRIEIPYSRPENFQRRDNISARSATSPYRIGNDEKFLPPRPRPGQTTTISLHKAVVDGDIEQVKLLISQGADVNSRNMLGWSPLHTALQNSRQAVIEPLIAEGADVNAKDNSGQTPLHIAVVTGQKDAVELLIAKGADVNVMSGSDNALTLAKRRQQTEIVDLLLKHGAKEPSPEDLMGSRYYGGQEGLNLYPGYGEQGTRVIRGTRTVGQSPLQVDILADPNEIRVRVKTFEGLEKALEEIAGKSQSEMRQWQQKRYDNRTMLIRTVQKQFEDEIGFIRKAAVDEEAKKTTAAIDSMLPKRQERFNMVNKELLVQKRELRQEQQPTRGRGRTRTTGRSTRGRTLQRGQQYGSDMTDPYGGRGDVMSRMTRPQSTTRPTEQVDMETENEINQWLQASFEDKTNLAEAVHQQLRLEIESVRGVAVEEGAKKTTAAIDGLLLYRQMRFEAYISEMEEEQQTLIQQTQDPRLRGRGRYLQDGQMQQENQPRTRRRR